ncbi:helix-turn-helix domain-containing protein [Pseudonocardia sp. GCM10023141]|uniref:helix-turn-helix domain-containing protein n=1 Tax=Pseudonocardia sp. GCM10023141 TaxID=3252653 RepID=UPI003611C58B
MTTLADGPVIPRRLIARELRHLRESHELNLEQLAAETEVSTSTLSRLENAQGTANPLTINALVRYYKVQDTKLGKDLTSWARAGRRPGWWRRYPGAERESNPTYVAYEAQAKVAKIYTITNVPIIFQTEEYAKIVARKLNPDKSDDELAAMVKFRLQRQSMIQGREGQPPLEVHAVLHELTFKQQVGSPRVMRDQAHVLLRAIEADAARPADEPGHVSIRILPESAEICSGMECPWVLFEYDNNLPGVCFLESHLGLAQHDDDHAIARASRDFDQLVASSLSESESAAFIRQLLDDQSGLT